MARKKGVVLHRHVYAVMRAIGDVVPRLDAEARYELFGVLTSILQYLQEKDGKKRSTEFEAVEAELQTIFRRPRARAGK